MGTDCAFFAFRCQPRCYKKLVPLDYELVVQVPGFADVNVTLEKLNNSGMMGSVKAPGSNLYYFDAPLICF